MEYNCYFVTSLGLIVITIILQSVSLATDYWIVDDTQYWIDRAKSSISNTRERHHDRGLFGDTSVKTDLTIVGMIAAIVLNVAGAIVNCIFHRSRSDSSCVKGTNEFFKKHTGISLTLCVLAGLCAFLGTANFAFRVFYYVSILPSMYGYSFFLACTSVIFSMAGGIMSKSMFNIVVPRPPRARMQLNAPPPGHGYPQQPSVLNPQNLPYINPPNYPYAGNITNPQNQPYPTNDNNVNPQNAPYGGWVTSVSANMPHAMDPRNYPNPPNTMNPYSPQGTNYNMQHPSKTTGF